MDELNGLASVYVNESSLIDNTFLTEHKYPSQCSSEVQKRAIRNKLKLGGFFVCDGVIYFKKIAKGKILHAHPIHTSNHIACAFTYCIDY